MADVSAKDGSQETMVNLAALVVNLLLLPFVDDRHGLLWILFIVFTCLHVYSNFKVRISESRFNQSVVKAKER